MLFINRHILFFLSLIFITLHVNAQETYTLQEALKTAKAQNPMLKTEQYEIEFAKSDVLSAKLRLNPTLENESIQLMKRSEFANKTHWYDGQNREVFWHISKPFQWAGQRKNTIDVANKSLLFTEEEYANIERELFLEVAQKWLEVWATQKQLADVTFEGGQTNIYRYNNKREITVRTNIRDRDQGGFVAELQERIDAEITIPKGYELIYGGQYENLERAGKQLIITIPLTLVVVFVFLFMLFKNFKHTLITISCVLFALAGGIIALIMRGYYFNVSAGVGFVSIFGISVMAGVLLVSALNRSSQKKELTKELVNDTSKKQLKAVLTILILAILGLVPAATSTGIGSDVQRPLATVIIGGLTSTLIFAPLLIPPLYWWKGRSRKEQE